MLKKDLSTKCFQFKTRLYPTVQWSLAPIRLSRCRVSRYHLKSRTLYQSTIRVDYTVSIHEIPTNGRTS